MKTLASILFGASALALTMIATTQPASARGYGADVERYRYYCSDPWYRQRYWDYCRRFYETYDDGYYGNGYDDSYDDGYYDDGYYDDYYGGGFYYDDGGDYRNRRHGRDRGDWGDRGHYDRGGHEHGDRGRGHEPERRGGDGGHEHHDHGGGEHHDHGGGEHHDHGDRDGGDRHHGR